MPNVNSVAEAAAAAPPAIPIAPGRMPWLGHVLPLFSKPLEFLRSLEKVGPLVRVDIGSLRMIVITNAQLTRQVLMDSRTFDKGGALYDKARDLVGESLLTSQSESHLRQRRLMQPAFHQDRIKGYATIMIEVIDSVLGEWRDGAVVDVTAAAYKITSHTAARSMFAAEVAAQDVARIVAALSIYFEGLYIRMMAPAGILPLLTIPGNIRYKRAVHTLHESVDKIIAAYRTSGTGHGDLLSMLLAARDDEGAPLTSQEIHNQVISLFLAGIETTAAVLAWSLYLLGEYPDAAERLHTEADTVLGGRAAQWNDLSQLNETRRVITETLRVYPPGWIFTRVAMQPAMLGEYHLPKGAGLAYSPYLLHHNSAVFNQPDRFDPGRWLPERAANLPQDAFIPFGGGVHKCIGDTFGMTEATLALATIVSQWTVHPTLDRPVQPAPRRVLLTPGRLPMRVHRKRMGLGSR